MFTESLAFQKKKKKRETYERNGYCQGQANLTKNNMYLTDIATS